MCKLSIIKQGLLEKKSQDVLHVDWTINQACNYRCSYCYIANKPKQEEHSLRRIFKTVDNLLFLKRPFYCFRLLGGEPTLFPHFGTMIERIYSKTTNAGILTITNGSRPPEWFQTHLRHIPAGYADIHISLHLEFANKEHIGEVLTAIAEMGHNATIRFMCHPLLGDLARDFISYFIRLRENVAFNLTLRALREPPDYSMLDRRYVQGAIEWMDDAESAFASISNDSDKKCPSLPPWGTPRHYFSDRSEKALIHNEAFRNGKMVFKDFWCNPEHTTICITPDFSWRGGACNAFPWMPFPIDSDEFRRHLPGMPVQCPYKSCGCDAVYFTPKFKNIKHALRHRRMLLLKRYLKLQNRIKGLVKCLMY